MSTSNVVFVGTLRFIPIHVDESNGCDGCEARRHCAKLPKCSGRNFYVIFKELND